MAYTYNEFLVQYLGLKGMDPYWDAARIRMAEYEKAKQYVEWGESENLEYVIDNWNQLYFEECERRGVPPESAI